MFLLLSFLVFLFFLLTSDFELLTFPVALLLHRRRHIPPPVDFDELDGLLPVLRRRLVAADLVARDRPDLERYLVRLLVLLHAQQRADLVHRRNAGADQDDRVGLVE